MKMQPDAIARIVKYAPTRPAKRKSFKSLGLPPGLPMDLPIYLPIDSKIPNILTRFPRALVSYQQKREKALERLASLSLLDLTVLLEQFIEKHIIFIDHSEKLFNELSLNETDAQRLESLLIVLRSKINCLKRLVRKVTRVDELIPKDFEQIVSHSAFLQVYYRVASLDLEYNSVEPD